VVRRVGRATALPSASNWERTHIDLGALAQRVTGTENSIDALSHQFTAQFSELSRAIAEQMKSINVKMDAQQNAYSSSRGTNWYAFASAAAAVAGVIGALVLALKAPTDQSIERLERDLGQLTAVVGQLTQASVSKSDYVYDKQILEHRFSDISSGLSRLDQDTMKRQEVTTLVEGLQATNKARLDAISSRLGETQKSFLEPVDK
jgi:uncharacterized coiled-coil protein SlyX